MIAKYRMEGHPGKWWLTDFTMEQVEGRIAALEEQVRKANVNEVRESIAETIAHDGPCWYCGKPTNSLAGNPGDWCIMLPHPENPGVVEPHHTSCVLARLDALSHAEALALMLRSDTGVEDWPEAQAVLQSFDRWRKGI